VQAATSPQIGESSTTSKTASAVKVKSCHKRKRMNKSARARAQKREREVQEEWQRMKAAEDLAVPSSSSSSVSNSLTLYDRVLVDVECSHDASKRHLHKLEGSTDAVRAKSSISRSSSDLQSLQLSILTNGFNQLRHGGILVYSTCSIQVAQNEGVVGKFLESHSGQVKLVPIFVPRERNSEDERMSFFRHWAVCNEGKGNNGPSAFDMGQQREGGGDGITFEEGKLPHTLRCGCNYQNSQLFIAKLEKI